MKYDIFVDEILYHITKINTTGKNSPLNISFSGFYLNNTTSTFLPEKCFINDIEQILSDDKCLYNFEVLEGALWENVTLKHTSKPVLWNKNIQTCSPNYLNYSEYCKRVNKLTNG